MKFYETKKGRAARVAWITESGETVDAGVLADQIRQFHTTLIGAHISRQIEALGLTESFKRGITPAPLPYTFA